MWRPKLGISANTGTFDSPKLKKKKNPRNLNHHMQSRIHKNMCTKLNVVVKILIWNMLVFNGFHLFF